MIGIHAVTLKHLCETIIKWWRMFSTSYFIYGKGEAKEDALKGDGREFLFMIVSILPVSLFRRNNQGII